MKRGSCQQLVVLWLIGQLALSATAAAQTISTSHEHIPNFAENATISSVTNGAWSNPGTWSPTRVPGPSDVVRVRHNVAFDSSAGAADVIGIDAGGVLRFVTNQSTSLRVGTLMILQNGALEVGTEASPIPDYLQAEIVIKNKPLNLSIDPDQFGTGILTINGRLTMHGAAKNPTWVRVASEPRAGNTTLVLEQPVSGWELDDLIVVPDSSEDPLRRNDSKLELRTIQSISADQRIVTLSSALAYTHPGARDLGGSLVFLPHVMNLTRNVVIRSEVPSGGTRGHTLHTSRSTVDVRYVEFRDLGRTTISPLDDSTNHIGRYALHAHHLIGPATTPANGYQFTLLGNAVLDTDTARSRIKWPIAIHDSHYGLIQGNAVYNAGGAGLVTEDGSESFNVIERNMVARVLGEGDRRGRKSNGAIESGSQGIGLWFRGANNYVRDNVGVNSVETGIEAGYGFEIFQEYVGNVRIPNYKGADTSVSGQYTTRSGYSIPILEFARNEAYGNPQGMTYWWLGSEYDTPVSTAESVFKDLRLWHISRYPIYAYQGNKVVLDGLAVYGDNSVANECCNVMWYGDYRNHDAVIRRSTIVGIDSVVLPYHASGTTLVEESFIAARWGLVNRTSGAPGACPNCNLPDRTQIFRKVRFSALPGRSLSSITMDFESHNGLADLSSKDEVFVYDYQGQAGNNFRAYYLEQATQNIAGGLASCNNTTARPEVSGITCPLSGSAPPPPPTNPPAAPTGVRIVSQ